MKKLTLIIFFLGFILVGCKVKPIIIEKYKVTYHENGGSEVEDIEVDIDTTIILPTPSRNGFTFIGWNDGNGNILNGEVIIKDSIELYAEWEKNIYTVTFTDDEGNIITTEKVEHNKNATLPPIPQKDGFSFVGWDKDHKNITLDVTIKAIFTESTSGLIFEKDNDNYIVTGYEGSSEKVVIPYRYNGLPVTIIGEEAFFENNQIKEVILPDTIEIISKNAFAGCNALEKINFPTSIVTIEESAFQNATSLTEVNINAKVIGLKAFYGNNNLSTIILNEGVIEIGELAFHSCSITEIIIPTSVNVIGNGAFNWCRDLKEIKTLNSNLEKLENLIKNANLIYTSPKVVGID